MNANEQVDEVAVRRFLAGHRISLTQAEREAVVVEARRREWRWVDIDALFGQSKGTARRFARKWNEQAVAEGREPIDMGDLRGKTVRPVAGRLKVELSPEERLLLEEMPTGGLRTWNRYKQPVTADEAAQHRAELEAAIRPQRRREAA